MKLARQDSPMCTFKVMIAGSKPYPHISLMEIALRQPLIQLNMICAMNYVRHQLIQIIIVDIMNVTVFTRFYLSKISIIEALFSRSN